MYQQFDEMQSSAGQCDADLRSTKTEIADLNRMIARLQNEIEAVKAQVKKNKILQIHVEEAVLFKSM